MGSVVWNPWSDQAREIGDLGDDEYPNMLCVEAGHVSTPVILLPGTAFEASQILQVKRSVSSFVVLAHCEWQSHFMGFIPLVYIFFLASQPKFFFRMILFSVLYLNILFCSFFLFLFSVRVSLCVEFWCCI